MSEQKVELLAPAGNYACFRAAINAGADAVYLGGEQYGARAYAGNFTQDEILRTLHIAHLFGRRIYLTVNTLVKESEFGNLITYMIPLYEGGLDGVIVQDIGVLDSLREHFPKLALHASTQMTVTGVYGAAYLKNMGVCRVVPARELSLDEMKDIKEKTGMEIECFVHGAMCYAYSGQCLFSSILGGRSGNRGRCAGPCRLPYTDSNHNIQYPLSLKDMYTLPILPELIQAGIDSFKIEGRMKSPEYVAGVTAVYRKYIDLYLTNPDNVYKIEEQDKQLLRHLYIRSDICSGYYKKHNDKSMVTLTEPGYTGSSPDILKEIQKRYIEKNILLPIKGWAKIYSEKPAELTLSYKDVSVTVADETVSRALNKPLSREDIAQKLGRLGDTCFALDELFIDTDEVSFMPVKALNELRRKAVVRLEQRILKQRNLPDKALRYENLQKRISKQKYSEQKMHTRINELCVLVTTFEQFMTVHNISEIQNIYIESDLCLQDKTLQNVLLADKKYFLVLPHILRKRSYPYLSVYEQLLDSGRFAGVLVRNFEELEWLYEIGYTGHIRSDYTIYAWNRSALKFLSGQLDGITLPLELNKKELDRLHADNRACFVLYGYIPLMYSANCVRKTLDHCIYETAFANNRYLNQYPLMDRYQNVFSVVQNCMHCYNLLYNTVPLSLHGQLEGILNRGYGQLRLDFSIENEAQMRSVIAYYLGCMTKCSVSEETKAFPGKNFTNGHYKRGVE